MSRPLEQVRDRHGRVWVRGVPLRPDRAWVEGSENNMLFSREAVENHFGPLTDLRGEGWTSHGYWVGDSAEPEHGFPVAARCTGPIFCPTCCEEATAIRAQAPSM